MSRVITNIKANKNKVHKLLVKNKDSAKDEISTGLNTEVFLDGKKFKGITDMRVEIGVGKVSKVYLALLADITFDLGNTKVVYGRGK
jgi:hypothetical protein